ncbi:MAG: shikimate dehydrogenase [Clostridia bacterium]|nr:shikimate dehydrogenase [Clostridia bacterium]
MTKRKLAVIGKDVSKSTSPQIHNFISSRLNLAVEYNKISVAETEFEGRIDALLAAYDGVNVTIPYKLAVIPHLKKVEGDAKIFGSVNTVNCGTLTGDNTDGLGFMLMLKNSGVTVSGKTALVLGAGGAGRSVAKKLADAGASVFVYDRNTENSASVEKEFQGVHALKEIAEKSYNLIVNATGVGMHKTEGVSPVSEKLLSLCEVAVDLIYVPEKSEFLRLAEKYGKKIVNGKAMLFYQAYYADCIFFGLQPDEEQAKKLFTEFCEVEK